MRHCSISGCSRPTTGYGHYCNAHRHQDRRHGSPLQRPVTAAEAIRTAKHIEKWIKGRKDPETIWKSMATAWTLRLEDAKTELRHHERGGAMIQTRRRAYEDIVSVGRDIDVKKIALRCCAVAYIAGHDQKRYVTDKAFFHQMARRFRTLTDANIATHWNPVTMKTKRVYRDTDPKRLEFLGELLAQTFGPIGLGIQCREAMDYDKAQEAMKAPVKLIMGAEEAAP